MPAFQFSQNPFECFKIPSQTKISQYLQETLFFFCSRCLVYCLNTIKCFRNKMVVVTSLGPPEEGIRAKQVGLLASSIQASIRQTERYWI